MQTRYELIISAVDKGVRATFNGVKEGVTRSGQAMTAFNKTMGNGEKIVAGLTSQLKNLVVAYAGLKGLQTLKDATLASQGLTIAFQSILGSGEAAAKELDFLRGASKDLRLEFYSTADGYKNLLAAGKESSLKHEEVRDIFLGISAAGVALRMSNDDLQGSLLAVTQMISKGKVSAEELRLQLGERLPGAVTLAAKALGVTTQELDALLQKGEVYVEDFIPKFAAVLHDRFGKAAKDAAADTRNLQAALNEFKTAWTDLAVMVAESGFVDVATDNLRSLTDLMKDPAFQKSVTNLAGTFFTLTKTLILFAVEWRNVILVLAGTFVAVKAIRSLLVLITALKAALLALTGLNVVAWFGALRGALVSVQAAFLAGGVAASAFYAAATLGAVWGIAKIIELGKVIWDTKKAWDSANASAERATALIDQVKNKYAGFKDVEIPGDITSMASKDLEKLNEDLHKTQAYYRVLKLELQEKAKETLLFGGMTVDARKAQAEIAGVDQKLQEVGAAIKEIGALQVPAIADMEPPVEMVAAIKASREEIEQFMKSAEEAYRHASSEAQKYADKIMKLNFDIADREISLQDRIRDLRRQNMEDYNAAKDLSANAMEKERAARESLLRFQQTGDQRQMDLTRQLAQDADRLWSEYARGGQAATESAISGLERVNKILDQADKEEISIFERMKDDAEKAMKDIEGWLDILTAARDLDISIELHNLTEAKKQINDLIKDETKKITIEVTKKVTEAKSTGGRVGMAGGGRFPGDSLFDSIPVLARPGEGFVRNEALKVWDRMFGKGFFDGINAPWSTAGQAIIRALQGQIRLPSLPAINRFSSGLAFAGGGRVPGFDIPRMGSVDLQYDGGSYPVIGDVDVLEQLQRAAGRKKRLRPNS